MEDQHCQQANEQRITKAGETTCTGPQQRMNERKKTEDEHVSTGKATLPGIKYEQRMRGNEQPTE